MAQIHAPLMVSAEPVSMEDVMEELQTSRNASMNLRFDGMGIVYKEHKQANAGVLQPKRS
jgi:DNA-binding transcriptional regulator GbsR (MarR family)